MPTRVKDAAVGQTVNALHPLLVRMCACDVLMRILLVRIRCRFDGLRKEMEKMTKKLVCAARPAMRICA